MIDGEDARSQRPDGADEPGTSDDSDLGTAESELLRRFNAVGARALRPNGDVPVDPSRSVSSDGAAATDGAAADAGSVGAGTQASPDAAGAEAYAFHVPPRPEPDVHEPPRPAPDVFADAPSFGPRQEPPADEQVGEGPRSPHEGAGQSAEDEIPGEAHDGTRREGPALTGEVAYVISRARDLASTLGHRELLAEHVIFAMSVAAPDRERQRIDGKLRQENYDAAKVRKACLLRLAGHHTASSSLDPLSLPSSDRVVGLLLSAQEVASGHLEDERRLVGLDDLLESQAFHTLLGDFAASHAIGTGDDDAFDRPSLGLDEALEDHFATLRDQIVPRMDRLSSLDDRLQVLGESVRTTRQTVESLAQTTFNSRMDSIKPADLDVAVERVVGTRLDATEAALRELAQSVRAAEASAKPASEQPAKPGGLTGWLRGLFRHDG